MGVSKVIYGANTLIDLTSDTVTPQTLALGYTAHDAAGNSITGAMSPGDQCDLYVGNDAGIQVGDLFITDDNLAAENIKKDVEMFGVTGTYEGSGGGMAFAASDAMARVNATSYTATNVKVTVPKTGTYTVRWYGYRSSTSGTNGSRLYVNGTATGAEQTTFSVNSNGQTVKLTGVQLTQGQECVVRARARSTSYYMWVMGLSIEQTA